ncbi:hypothetical protein E4U19_003872 [Claviceps sp. Clav32 group G5]|nr:hypothetical protein E4U19_003872 [Claviceps sp. Clav32 group G5]KAG6044023.1 hypothetical protein E4U39_003877 [Claviceps sp. Clav50 group G5]
MSSTRLKAAIHIVNTPATLLSLINSLHHRPTLYMDLQGCNVSRKGTIYILTLYIGPIPRTTTGIAYMVDIRKLGKSAFTTRNQLGTTLKSILESAHMRKIVFDVRNMSDALFHHFQVSLQGIQDLQLMELASRGKDRKHVRGLNICLEKDGSMCRADRVKWDELQRKTTRLIESREGCRCGVFYERPLREGILEYCAGNVAFLPGLYNAYERKLNPAWRELIRSATEDRIRHSQSVAYEPFGRAQDLGPWDGFCEDAADFKRV